MIDKHVSKSFDDLKDNWSALIIIKAIRTLVDYF